MNTPVLTHGDVMRDLRAVPLSWVERKRVELRRQVAVLAALPKVGTWADVANDDGAPL